MKNSFTTNSKFDYQVQNDSTLIITGYSGSNSELEIPSEIKHKTVTAIGEQAFSGCDSLRKIIIPDSVTSIGNQAFSNCKNLKEIIIPGSLSGIGESLFQNCTKLQTITIVDLAGKNYSLDITDLSGKNTDPRPYLCPYCGKEITKENVLFWQSVKDRYTDNIRGDFLCQHGVDVPAGYKFNRVYYRARPGINVIREDENGFPAMIDDSPTNAIAPEELDSDIARRDIFDDDFSSDCIFTDDSVSEGAEPDSFDADSDSNRTDSDSFDDDFDSNGFVPDSFDEDFDSDDPDSDSFDYDDYSENYGDDSNSDDFCYNDERPIKRQRQESNNITMRACPYCHCELPQKFGTIETHHVAVLGGRASGKTAYLVKLFQQMSYQMGVNDLGSVDLEAESKNYLEPMIADYERDGTTRPTPEDGIMPIVCHYKNPDHEAFIIFHEIPSGEAAVQHLGERKELCSCKTLLLMVDPNMFVGGAFFWEWNANHLGDDYRIDVGDCYKEPLDRLLYQDGRLCLAYLKNIRNIICVVTKIDMLLESASKFFSSGDIEILSDMKGQHYGVVNNKVLQRVSDNLRVYLEKQQRVNLKDELKEAFGKDVRISCLCVSTSTLDPNRTRPGTIYFKPDSSPEQSGHRIIEPFLTVLLQLGLVQFRNEDPMVLWPVRSISQFSDYPPLVNELAAQFAYSETPAQADNQDNDIPETDDFDFDF